jgi:proline iminopeptidase
MTRLAGQLALAATAVLVGCSGLPVGEAMKVIDREGYVETRDGVKLGYRKVGAGGQTIVVLHGGPGFTMDYLADDLLPLAQRHTLIFYDQRGAGRSSLVSEADALDGQRFAEDLEAIRRHFGLGKLNLMGHSWGAAVAALYAVRFPEHIGRLIIVGGAPLRRSEFDRVFARLRADSSPEWLAEVRKRSAAWRGDPGSAAACREFVDTWFIPFVVDRTAWQRSKGDFCAGTPDSLKNRIAHVDRFVVASLGDYDWRAPLRTLQAPTLIIHGAADPIPAETAVEWSQTLPNARLLLLGNVGHFPYLEAPAEFFAAVERFMKGEWPAGVTAR